MAEQPVLTIRLPPEMAEALRTYTFATDNSANDTIEHAVADHPQERTRTEMVQEAFEKTLRQHSVALDELRDL